MNIKVVFGSTCLNPKLSTGWGLSYLINNKILFDTGGNSDMLFNNIDSIGVKISNIKNIIISHDHWDHTNGLHALLKKNPKIKVYSCHEFNNELKDKIKTYSNSITQTNYFTEINRNIFLTGSIQGEYKSRKIFEQALVLKTTKGLTIITGCAHPGIIRIIETIKKEFCENIHFIMGGFHLKDKTNKEIVKIVKQIKEIDVKLIGPGHCTGETAMNLFKKYYKNDYIEVEVGKNFEV